MNKCLFTGRLTKDPEVRYTQEGKMAIARFSLAIDKLDKEHSAGFINVVAFGKLGEFSEKYLRKGVKIELESHVSPGSYNNKEGVKVYTFDFVAEKIDFAESKNSGNGNKQTSDEISDDGFVDIPDGAEELPFE
ncbi:MAG: single-stranded DNA-binding protein [Butyrivibrio sp.]|nr:single-stranded DNA-binding protein [Butyrivibrio sp.]